MPTNKKTNKKQSMSSRNAKMRKPRARAPLALVQIPPSSRRVRLVYPYWTSVTESSANAGAFRYYRLNSVYDVDTTIGSTTTPGFNEWAAFFSNYRVWRCRIRIEGAVSGGSSGSLATVCLVPNALQATLPSNSNEWPVQPLAVHTTIVPESNGGKNTANITKEYDISKLARITRRQFTTDMDFTATTASNPARQSFVAVTVSGVNSTTAVTLTYQVYVAMEIEFFNPIQLST
jgi:hypothetical protein